MDSKYFNEDLYDQFIKGDFDNKDANEIESYYCYYIMYSRSINIPISYITLPKFCKYMKMFIKDGQENFHITNCNILFYIAERQINTICHTDSPDCLLCSIHKLIYLSIGRLIIYCKDKYIRNLSFKISVIKNSECMGDLYDMISEYIRGTGLDMYILYRLIEMESHYIIHDLTFHGSFASFDDHALKLMSKWECDNINDLVINTWHSNILVPILKYNLDLDMMKIDYDLIEDKYRHILKYDNYEKRLIIFYSMPNVPDGKPYMYNGIIDLNSLVEQNKYFFKDIISTRVKSARK